LVRKRKKENEIVTFLNQFVFNTKTLPIVISITFIGVMFVLIRMKGIELDYKYNEIAKKTKVKQLENKELKADRARVLSVKKLKGFAKENNLKEPDEKHIIIIP
jgi:hypothetical protein